MRSRKADALLWRIRSTILLLAREGKLEPTLAGIARQLNENGLQTNQKNRFDAQKVHRALGDLGVDRMAIKRWQRYAGQKAAEFEVSLSCMIEQLWQEWLWHESNCWVGDNLKQGERPFVPKLVHPNEWVPPWIREPRSPVRMVQASPPAARVVYAMLGAFAPET